MALVSEKKIEERVNLQSSRVTLKFTDSEYWIFTYALYLWSPLQMHGLKNWADVSGAFVVSLKRNSFDPFLVEKGVFFQLANLCEKDYFQLSKGEEHKNSKNTTFGFRAPDRQTMNFVHSEDEGDRLDSISVFKVSIHVFF